MFAKRINTVLVTAVTLAVTLAVAFMVGHVTNAFHGLALDLEEQAMRQTARATVQSLDLFLDKGEIMTRSLVAQAALHEAAAGAPARADARLAEYLRGGDYWALLVFDLQGRVLAGRNAAGENLTGRDLSARDYVRAILAGAESFTSPEIISVREDGQGQALAQSRALRGPDGGLQGGVAVLTYWHTFTQAFIDPPRFVSSGHALMFDARGRIIAHATDRELIFQDMSHEDLVREALTIRTGELTAPWRGDLRYYALAEDARTGWIVCMSAPVAELTKAADAQRDFLLALGGLTVLLLVATISLLVGALVVRPIKAMKTFTSAVARGDFSAGLKSGACCELQDLAGNLQHMVAELKRRLGFAQSVLSGFTLPCAVVDPENRLTFLNQRLLTAFGKGGSPMDYLGVNSGQFLFDDPNHVTYLVMALREERTVSGEVRYQLPQGEKIFDVTATPIRDMDNTLLGALAVWFDMTEVRAQEGIIASQKDLLAENEERYRTLFMNTGAATILVAEDTRIQLANPEFLNLVGLGPRDLVTGRSWTEFFHPDDLPRMREYHILRRKTPGLAPRGYESRILTRRHEVREVHLTVAAIPGTGLSVASIMDITAQKTNERQLERQAFYDALTGLANRQLFQDRLRRSMLAASREESQVGLLLLDLDEFKHVNDSLGHSAGDLILREAAARFASALRHSDTLARLGGDEFAVILEDLDGIDALMRVAKDLLGALRAPFKVEGAEIYLGVSVGIAVYPLDAEDAERLVQCADLAMYRAKEQGKNTFGLYKKDLNDQAVRRLTLEAELRQALAEERFRVLYQPKVEAADGRVSGMEALVRWLDAGGNLRPPSAFIPFAESSGLIVPIDLFVLEQACRQAAAWKAAGHQGLTLSVNLSAQHFRRLDLPKRVMEILARTGLNPGDLELEITETALLKNFQAAQAMMEDLRSHGVRFALDDFGAGYSSMSYLMALPLQAVKMDKTFVDRIAEESGRGRALARAILSMAEGLGLPVVAEGVETEAQLAFLRKEGCRYVQGYLFAPPLPAEEFEALLARGTISPSPLAQDAAQDPETPSSPA